MANELPHKAAYEACNPTSTLISEAQVAEDEGIKIATLRYYSHASIKAAVGTRLDPVCKDEAGIRWYLCDDVDTWKAKRAETKARCLRQVCFELEFSYSRR